MILDCTLRRWLACAAVTIFAAGAAPAGDSAYPGWWAVRGVVDPGAADTNDFAALNQGQLKWLARQAGAELEANLRHGAGADVQAMLAGFPQTGNYAAVNVGQLKSAARPFFQRLIAEGCALEYPWTGRTDDDADFAAANIGQAKFAFSFDLDPDRDGLPDWWELENAGDTVSLRAADDEDGDGLGPAGEFRQRTDVAQIDSDADGVDDALDANPALAADSDGDGLPDDWERRWFGGLAQTAGDDPDGDGRANATEMRELTSPVWCDAADVLDAVALVVYRPQ